MTGHRQKELIAILTLPTMTPSQRILVALAALQSSRAFAVIGQRFIVHMRKKCIVVIIPTMPCIPMHI
jgi:hypothetical protein|eukprot:COSAG01_NODE_164_length_23340_cov_76.030033_22_plen_68_part_00